MTAIVAVDKHWGIGYKGSMLFHNPKDLAFFKEKTMGRVIIMGRATFESLPNGALPGRRNIILSKSGFIAENAETISDISELYSLLSPSELEGLYVIGGEAVYQELLPFCNTAYVTKMMAEAKADRFFPNLDEHKGWELVEESATQSYKGLGYNFCRYINALVIFRK